MNHDHDVNRLVYMAGPIANVTPEQARGWRGELHTELHKIGLIGFDPSRAWGQPPRHLTVGATVQVMQAIDDYAVAMSRLAVVRYEPGVESVGTDHEIGLARVLNKPILVWAERPYQASLNPNLELEIWLRERFPGCLDPREIGPWGAPAFLHFSLMSLTYHMQDLTR